MTVDCLQPCGCGGKFCAGQVRLYRDHAIHFRGKHWRIGCIAYTLMEEAGEKHEECGCDWLGDPDELLGGKF
jgi:hypothetical protein